MNIFRGLLSSTVALMLAAVIAQPASAHSFPEQESPSAGQQLSVSPSKVTIKFDAPIEKLFAKLEVLDSDGKPHNVGSPEIGAEARTLSIKVVALKPGEYTVKWGVVCIDSHHTEGSYVFTVTDGG